MSNDDFNLDLLLQETLALTEYLRVSGTPADDQGPDNGPDMGEDYLFDFTDSLIKEKPNALKFTPTNSDQKSQLINSVFPETSGIIYRIDSGASTFCVRGFAIKNIRAAMTELENPESVKRAILKLNQNLEYDELQFFETPSFELAEAIREQVINRRFPHQEDAVCNISDPGFSWWMNLEQSCPEESRFEIFFRSHGINRAEKYVQLGPIGDPGVVAQRMNQARSLLRSSFPISEFSCDDKSFTVASSKPDHLSFVSFRNIFLHGVNNTEIENFPDNSIGRSLFYYFHELAIVRKFWIEVKSKLC